MQNAVNQYVSSNPFVFPVDRQDLSITLRTSDVESHARVLTVSVQEKSFHIVSKYTSFQLLPLGMNRRDVCTMSVSLENAISHHGTSISF